MPDKKTIEKAHEDKREGKSASTHAGEFVKEEVDKIRRGEHGMRNAKQAIAIGLSEARRGGVDIKPRGKGETGEKSRKSQESAYIKGQRHEPVSPTHSRRTLKKQQEQRRHTANNLLGVLGLNNKPVLCRPTGCIPIETASKILAGNQKKYWVSADKILLLLYIVMRGGAALFETNI